MFKPLALDKTSFFIGWTFYLLSKLLSFPNKFCIFFLLNFCLLTKSFTSKLNFGS
jgi:hypothetical protein